MVHIKKKKNLKKKNEGVVSERQEERALKFSWIYESVIFKKRDMQ